MPLRKGTWAKYESKIIQSRSAQTNLENISPEALRARTDFIAFREYVCGHKSPSHHLSWVDQINTGVDSKCLKGVGGPHTLILAPRGSAKSSWTVEWTSFQIGHHITPFIGLAIKILYISYSIDIALGKSEQIKSILDSPRYQEVFPWIRKGAKWGDKLWDIDKLHAGLSTLDEPYTLATAGMKGAVASRRAHLVVMDDLIKSPEQVDNPLIRDKMASNWTNVIRPTMYEGSRAICLGTRMHWDDIYASTFTEENGWNVIEQAAILEDDFGQERSYWPEQFSLQFLQSLQDDPVAFSLQYQNRIPKEGEGIVPPDWWLEGDCPPLDELDAICIGSDFSASRKETADYTVFLLMGRKDDKYYIYDLRRGRYSGNIDKCSALLSLLLDWEILDTHEEYEYNERTGLITFTSERPLIYATRYHCNFYAESKGYQVSFKSDYIQYFQQYLDIWTITCVPLDLKGDKTQKLRGISGVFQRNQVIANRYSKSLKRLKTELLGFGSTRFDDCVDALVLGMNGLGARPVLGVA